MYGAATASVVETVSVDSESRDIEEVDDTGEGREMSIGLSDLEDDSDDVSVHVSVSSESLLSKLALISSFRLSATAIVAASSTCSISMQSDTLGILVVED